jgi:hypothetical protein
MMRCAIVAPMTNRSFAPFLAITCALSLACGIAQAQFKAPAKLQPKDGLGSGIGSQPGSSSPSLAPPAATPPASAPAGSGTSVAPADDKASAEAVVQDIANCVLAGLPPDWTLAQVEVTELGRNDKQREFEATYSYKDGAGKAAPFSPCDPREPALNVYKLNGALEPAKRNWIRATLVFSKEGKFELQYDYAKDAAKDAAKPAGPARPDAKKDAKKTDKKK